MPSVPITPRKPRLWHGLHTSLQDAFTRKAPQQCLCDTCSHNEAPGWQPANNFASAIFILHLHFFHKNIYTKLLLDKLHQLRFAIYHTALSLNLKCCCWVTQEHQSRELGRGSHCLPNHTVTAVNRQMLQAGVW